MGIFHDGKINGVSRARTSRRAYNLLRSPKETDDDDDHYLSLLKIHYDHYLCLRVLGSARLPHDFISGPSSQKSLRRVSSVRDRTDATKAQQLSQSYVALSKQIVRGNPIRTMTMIVRHHRYVTSPVLWRVGRVRDTNRMTRATNCFNIAWYIRRNEIYY